MSRNTTFRKNIDRSKAFFPPESFLDRKYNNTIEQGMHSKRPEMNRSLAFEMFGKKHPYVSSYPHLSSVIPNIVPGVELLKQLQRKKNRCAVPPQSASLSSSSSFAAGAVAATEQRTSCRKGMQQYIHSAQAHDATGYRSGKNTLRFIGDTFCSYGLHDKNTRLRFTSEFGTVYESKFTEGVSWDLAVRAAEKLRSCISSCSRASPLHESWEYVHEGNHPEEESRLLFAPPSSGDDGKLSHTVVEPDFVTHVQFLSSCDRPVVTHTKRLRLWSCTIRPQSSHDHAIRASRSGGAIRSRAKPSIPPLPARGGGAFASENDNSYPSPPPVSSNSREGDSSAAESESESESRSRRRSRVLRGLRESRDHGEDVILAEGCADMQLSLVAEREYALGDGVVLPKLTRIIKRLDFDFVEDGLTWRYSLSFVWSGQFDEDAEYSMATDAAAACVVRLIVEPLNLGTYLCSTSGPKSSSVYQTISLILKSTQLIDLDHRTSLRCLHTPSPSPRRRPREAPGAQDFPSVAVPPKVSDAMVWAFRTRRIAGDVERRNAAERRRRARAPTPASSSQLDHSRKVAGVYSGDEVGDATVAEWSGDPYNFHFEERTSKDKIEILWAWMSISSP